MMAQRKVWHLIAREGWTVTTENALTRGKVATGPELTGVEL